MKLDKLPDRTPVKLAVSFAPDDHADLIRYADMYSETYGEHAAPADLVPFIVRAFLAEDREFKRLKKGAAARGSQGDKKARGPAGKTSA